MAKLTLNTIGSRYGSVEALNDNFDAIEQALENTFSLDGTSPNALEADLDMNNNDILNAGEVNTETLRINGVLVEPSLGVTTGAVFQTYEFTATAGQTTFSVSPATPQVSSINVFVNGLQLSPSEISVSTTNVILPAMTAGDEVVIRRYTTDPVAAPDATNINFLQAGTGAVTRTSQDKMRDVVSVKDFGAVGDGVTDDTAAIQAAINAARAAKKLNIYFPSGKYIASTITLYSGLSIYGDYQGSFGLGTSDTTNGYGSTYWATVLQQKAGTNAHFIRFVPLNQDATYDYIGPVSIQSLSIVGDSSSTFGDGIRFQGASNFGYADNAASPRPTITQAILIIRDVLVRNFKGNGIWLPCPHAGVNIDNVYSGFNGGAGLYIDCTSSQPTGAQINNLNGDANLGDQIVVYGMGSTFATSDGKDANLVITNLLAEQRVNTCSFAAGAVGNNHAITFDNCNSGVVTINGVTHYSIVSGAGGNVGDTIYLQNQTAGYSPTISANGVVNTIKYSLGQTAAGNILNDVVNAKTIPSPVSVFVYGYYYPTISVNSVGTTKPWFVAGQNTPQTVSVPSGGFQAIGGTPAYVLWESDQGADGKGWAWIASGGQLTLRLASDAGATPTTAINVTRSGTSVTLMDFSQPSRFSNLNFNLTALGVYADEAAATAAGLPSGRVYRTATGELRIKL